MLAKRHTSRETKTVLNFLNKNMWCHLPDLYIRTSGLEEISSYRYGFRVDLSLFSFFEKHASKALLMNNNKETCRRITDKTSGGTSSNQTLKSTKDLAG